ncbi:hypothetical protein SBV1_2320007 [Verrucomicrobia bacterium]|nr:hypothetical protein SBV1_2320007 [Verrucomicrobiota bacterium]
MSVLARHRRVQRAGPLIRFQIVERGLGARIHEAGNIDVWEHGGTLGGSQDEVKFGASFWVRRARSDPPSPSLRRGGPPFAELWRGSLPSQELRRGTRALDFVRRY